VGTWASALPHPPSSEPYAMARATNKLTGPEVKNATFEKYGKRTRLADGNGLYLDVQQAGRYWRLKYRYAGKEKLLALGAYPDITLKQARIFRDEARQLLANGTDPAAYRRQSETQRRDASADTFRAVAGDWLKLQQGQLSDSTINVTRNRLTNWIYPHLGSLPIIDIEPPLALQVLRKIEAKGEHETAHRMRQRISQIYRFAISEGRATRDPSADLRGLLKTAPAKNRAAIVKPSELGGLLRAIDGYSGQPATCAALQLAPLVFLRPGELRMAVWD